MSKNSETKKCNSCKKNYEICDFMNNKNKELVTCITCRNKKKKIIKKSYKIKVNKCEICGKTGNFNKNGENNGRFCSKHKLFGMIDVIHPKCEACNKIPFFNFKGENNGRFCVKHKLDNMINVVSNTCEFENCYIRPHYNFKDETKGRFCFSHKLDNMINVVSNTCEFENCNIQPHFNFKGETKGRFCSGHKLDKMINVKSMTCEFENCDKRPHFNFKDNKTGRFCFLHKLKNMVNVTSIICESINCKKRASFGFCSQSVTRCAEHKLKNMFKKPKRKCNVSNCKEIATFGQNEPKHCETHSQENEICFLTKKCNLCRDIDILNKDGICITKCKPLEYFEQIKKYQKEKEINMLIYLDQNLKEFESEYKIIDDKLIDTSCNLYRPDRRYDCGTHQVIVECDEHQHKNREYCEKYTSQKHFEECRMFEIQQACGMNCIFIRWNPDTFRVNGILYTKVNIKKRLDTLLKWVKYCINLKIEKESPPQYIQLFFDEYDETNVDFISIEEKNVIY